ncbi:type VI secretion system ImpA family N-terminal domain-containing protein [Vibrio sp. S4M6]|uniref:type VI secretion system protein TssA n=1 Tax=Vibrio sinus TaxID=2946865 RepID=UPI00202ABDFD|nr:type VI secretion system ImpA family N-terminal domain-containing protein [Vibrio sinus]MCL9781221.1 type VI secretion system ImpA family N-terminal domain-containing protein [Vibrio sinus]
MTFSFDQISILSKPISDKFPCGTYLKLDTSAFRPLRNEFNMAQTAQRKLSQNPSDVDKERLERECHQCWLSLASNLYKQFHSTTRDIELITWFIAAQLVLDPSLESTANSIEWLSNLVEQQWKFLNPVLPESKLKADTLEAREAEQARAKIFAFFQLIGENKSSSLLYAPLMHFKLIDNVSFFDFQSALKRGELDILKAKVKASVSVACEREAIQKKASNTARCVAQLERLERQVTKQANHFSIANVNFAFVIGLFSELGDAFVQLTDIADPKSSERPAPQDLESENKGNDKEQSVSVCSGSIRGTGSIQKSAHLDQGGNLFPQEAGSNSINRDQVFHLLRDISDYFRESEPHSPVSFLLEKAIRWGYMPLPELLQEMMTEQGSDLISKVFNTAGLNQLDRIELPNLPKSSSGKGVVDGTVRSPAKKILEQEGEAEHSLTSEHMAKKNNLTESVNDQDQWLLSSGDRKPKPSKQQEQVASTALNW